MAFYNYKSSQSNRLILGTAIIPTEWLDEFFSIKMYRGHKL